MNCARRTFTIVFSATLMHWKTNSSKPSNYSRKTLNACAALPARAGSLIQSLMRNGIKGKCKIAQSLTEHLLAARQSVGAFVNCYNQEHRHSAIRPGGIRR